MEASADRFVNSEWKKKIGYWILCFKLNLNERNWNYFWIDLITKEKYTEKYQIRFTHWNTLRTQLNDNDLLSQRCLNLKPNQVGKNELINERNWKLNRIYWKKILKSRMEWHDRILKRWILTIEALRIKTVEWKLDEYFTEIFKRCIWT